jgi:hypothetical protein
MCAFSVRCDSAARSAAAGAWCWRLAQDREASSMLERRDLRVNQKMKLPYKVRIDATPKKRRYKEFSRRKKKVQYRSSARSICVGEPDNTTRRKTSTTRPRRPRPRRPSDQHVGSSRRLGTACGGCRQRISSGNNLSVPAQFNWSAPHPKFQAPVTSRFVPDT